MASWWPYLHTILRVQVPNSSRIGAEAGMPIALESEDAEGQSAEEREAALNAAVDKRMEEIQQLRGLVAAL